MALAAVIALTAAAFAAVAPVGDPDPRLADPLFYASSGTAFLGILGAYLIQHRTPEAIAAAASEEAAAEVLFRRSVFSAAAVEVPAWLGLVGLLLTADMTFLLFALPLFVVLALLFPTHERVEQQLRAVRGATDRSR